MCYWSRDPICRATAGQPPGTTFSVHSGWGKRLLRESSPAPNHLCYEVTGTTFVHFLLLGTSHSDLFDTGTLGNYSSNASRKGEKVDLVGIISVTEYN